jgi:hypothetical protein
MHLIQTAVPRFRNADAQEILSGVRSPDEESLEHGHPSPNSERVRLQRHCALRYELSISNVGFYTTSLFFKQEIIQACISRTTQRNHSL